MKNFLKYFLIFCLLLPDSAGCFAQNANSNSSFVFSDFSTFTIMPVASLTATDDGGFAYVKAYQPWTFEMLENNKLKYVNIDRNLYQSKNMDMEYVPCVFFKVSKYGKIQFVKLLGKRIGGSCVKQTNDQGYIIAGYGNITKLDKQGNQQWQLLFNIDSIPSIKKTKFLLGTQINDITECIDGSFIAILNASFSLLKISKEGKALWLKSTVFDEFSPMYFDYNEKQKMWIEKTDTIGINEFVYEQGGGIYIPTYNVYETYDGGYMAIGKNEYRYKAFITDYTDSNKVFITTRHLCKGGRLERYSVPRPSKIYGIRQYLLNDEEKEAIHKQSTTVVVKTDKNGKVLWAKQFGNMSYDTEPHSDLIKFKNGNWLLRIRDCEVSQAKNTYEWNKYGSPSSHFFMIDNNGNTISTSTMPYGVYDPNNMILAADSGYFLLRQGSITKTDKNFNVEWQRGTGDISSCSAAKDTGIFVGLEGGWVVKYDKYGNIPSKDFNVTVRNTGKAEITLDVESNMTGNLIIERSVPKKEQVTQYYRFKKNMPKNEDASYTELMIGNDSIIDLNKPETMDYLFVNAWDLKYQETRPSKLDIDNTRGFKHIKIINLGKGEYTYTFSSEATVLATGKFVITDGY